MILNQKVLGKKSSNKWKCMIHNSRFFFSSDLFSSGLFYWDLISWDFIAYWQPPYYFRKKKSQESKTQDFISIDIFFQGLDKIRTFFPKFLFPGFFQKLFFPGLSNVDSGDREQFLSNLLIHMFIGTPCTIYIYPVSYSKYHV